MFFAEANWASGHEAASKGRTHDRIRAATESSYLALESRAVPHMTHVLTLPWLFSAGVTGVIDMELLSVIRRWALRDQLSIREIARRTGLSRNTIRKYLRGDVVEPVFKLPERPSKLDAFAAKLSAWLKLESGKSRKQRRTVKQLHADLVALGFEGSYGRVAAFARSWKEHRQQEQQTAGRGTFVPLIFQPGEAFQFD